MSVYHTWLVCNSTTHMHRALSLSDGWVEGFSVTGPIRALRWQCTLIHLLMLVLYKLFVCLLNFFPYFLPYLFTSWLIYFLTSLLRIDPLHFQIGGRRRRPNLALVCVNLQCKKVKASHTRYWALGPELIPVYRQSADRWL